MIKKIEEKRKPEDRRKVHIKDHKTNQRRGIRRDDDIANIRSYYTVLSLCIMTLLIVGIISFIWGR